MNSRIVSTTEVQRNFKQVLAKLQSSNEPLVVVRDSQPEAVMLPYVEYQRLADLEKSILKVQMDAIWKELEVKNKKISEKEIERDIKEALQKTSGY